MLHLSACRGCAVRFCGSGHSACAERLVFLVRALKARPPTAGAVNVSDGCGCVAGQEGNRVGGQRPQVLQHAPRHGPVRARPH